MRVLHCDGHTRIEHMLQALRFMFIKQSLFYNECVVIYQMLNNMLPVVLRNRIEMGSDSERQTGRRY